MPYINVPDLPKDVHEKYKEMCKETTSMKQFTAELIKLAAEIGSVEAVRDCLRNTIKKKKN